MAVTKNYQVISDCLHFSTFIFRLFNIFIWVRFSFSVIFTIIIIIINHQCYHWLLTIPLLDKWSLILFYFTNLLVKELFLIWYECHLWTTFLFYYWYHNQDVISSFWLKKCLAAIAYIETLEIAKSKISYIGNQWNNFFVVIFQCRW